MDLKTIAIGHPNSPTAIELMKQIEKEEKEAQAQARQEAQDQAYEQSRARAAHIQKIRQESEALLEKYQGLANEVMKTLIALEKLQRQLPEKAHSQFPPHLRRVHVPNVKLKDFEPLIPVWTTMEAALAAI